MIVEDIDIIREEGILVPFKIVDVKKGGFLVVVKDHYGFVPFNLMPWNYYLAKYWEPVAMSLKTETFYGKILEIYRTDNNEISRIYIDARMSPLAKADLCINEDYQGIVMFKKPFGVFIDIGYHFKWKCGSLKGLVHQSKFPNPESFDLCEPGQIINVNYFGRNEQGLCFTVEGYVDLYTKYAGKKVWVRVIRNWDGSLSFRAEDRYKTIMPITKSIYEEKKDLVIDSVKYLSDGEIIDCEVLDIKEYADVFVVKWFSQSAFKKYIGKTLQVKVCRKEDGELDFLIFDRYKAEMSLEIDIYENPDLVKSTIDSWRDSEIVNCEVLDVDLDKEQFLIKWLPQETENMEVESEWSHETELPDIRLKVVGKIDLDLINQKTRPKKKSIRALQK